MTDRTPDVSVSIVNTNNCEMLLACLESLTADDHGDVDVEIVVLDNASEDGSAAAVRERFPTVRLIAQEFRNGFGANHNTVIRATSGRYVYILNDDTTAADWGFQKMVSYLDARPRAGALGPRIVYPDGTRQDSAWRFPSPLRTAVGALTLNQFVWAQSRAGKRRLVDWTSGAAMLVRRAALDEVGLFDERFFIYSEEVDLCRRIRRAGWEIHHFPDVTVTHHQFGTSESTPERRINEMWRSRHLYWQKHHSRIGARAAALLTGWQYLSRAGIAAVLLRMPERLRPRIFSQPVDPKQFRLHAKGSWRVTGPGIRELAEEWNARKGSGGR
jgi:GT2 family glycosyltransferase